MLRAKGYEVEYRDFAGGHDWVNWRGSIADGLMTLIGPPAPCQAFGPDGELANQGGARTRPASVWNSA